MHDWSVSAERRAIITVRDIGGVAGGADQARGAGPRVAASTWNRELAMVSGFFAWAMRQRLVESNPVPMQVSRDHGRRAGGDSEVPAARARDAAGDRVEWLTPDRWRCMRPVAAEGS